MIRATLSAGSGSGSNQQHKLEDEYTRILFISSFPEGISNPYIGQEYRKVSVIPIAITQTVYCCLLAEGFECSKSLNQLVCIVLEAVKQIGPYPQNFMTFKDLTLILRRARKKINDHNASESEGIVAAILEVANIDRTLIRNMIWDLVKGDVSKLADYTEDFDGKTLEYCQHHSLILTPGFRRSLRQVIDILKSHNHLLLFGDPVSRKTQLWKAAIAAMDFEVMIVSSLAIRKGALDVNKLNADGAKDLLLVIEGSLTKEMMDELNELIEQGSYILREDSQLVVRERNIKIVIETSSISNLSPSIANFFKLHRCENEDVTYSMMIGNKIHKLLSILKVRQYQDIVVGAVETYVTHLIKCRKLMGFNDSDIKIHHQINSMIKFAASVMNGKNSLDEESIVHTIIYSCVYCFSQDFTFDVKERAEIRIRSLFELRNVPTEYSIFDHFYDCDSKLWKPFLDHPLCANLKKANIVLHQHFKQEIISKTLIEFDQH